MHLIFFLKEKKKRKKKSGIALIYTGRAISTQMKMIEEDTHIFQDFSIYKWVTGASTSFDFPYAEEILHSASL